MFSLLLFVSLRIGRRRSTPLFRKSTGAGCDSESTGGEKGLCAPSLWDETGEAGDSFCRGGRKDQKGARGCPIPGCRNKKRGADSEVPTSIYNQYSAAGGVQGPELCHAEDLRIAQQLYEGIDIKGQGTIGIITYLRTDSTRISEEAEASARDYIAGTYGPEYVADAEKKKDGGKKIQDAHEAIRPTDISRTPAMVKESLSRDQFRLYQLIWKRL